MSMEPGDEIIENEIKTTLASMDELVRPNKLRKLICKKVKGTNWTQYQRVLDAMIDNKVLQTIEDDGETKIQPLKDSSVAVASSTTKSEQSQILTAEMNVPFEIITYISKKGAKKRRNIESNTKTSISYDDETTKALRSNSSQVETSTLTITKTWECVDQDGNPKKAKKQAKNLMKHAKIFISKMVESYKDNPDHFAARKTGGTFAEQSEAKKRKLEAMKNAKKNKYKKPDQNFNENDVILRSKKKRKFF